MRLAHMLRKEFLLFRRNPVLLRMAILLPLLQTFVLSYAANLDITNVPLTVCDEDHSAAGRDLVARLDALPYFRLVAYRLRPAELEDDLGDGSAVLALHLPPGFARDLERGTATLQVLVDGADSSGAAVAAGYVAQVAAAFDIEVRQERIARLGLQPRLPSVEVRPRVFYNPDLRSVWYMAPGVMALILTVLMQNLTALSIARERELGTLEQLVMTPIRPWELLLGKLLPFAIVGCLDALLVVCLVRGWFGVPLRGDALTLAVATVPFLGATLGLGLLVSTVSANQQQAQLMNFFFSFPAILLSGFVFPVANLPVPLQWVSQLVPMTHYLVVIRGVFLRAAGFAALWPTILALAVLAVCYFSLGALRFHKRLD